jgi:hypothetical protein
MSDYLTEQQVEYLLRGIQDFRVRELDGHSHVEQHDIRAHLTRVFGFARWSFDVTEQHIARQVEVTMKNTKPGWNIVAHSIGRLTVCAPSGRVLATYTEGHVGQSTGPVYGDVLGNAITNSESYALKRCAISLGDQFGLSLYNKGSQQPIVTFTLLRPGGDPQVFLPDVPAVEQESLSSTPTDAFGVPLMASA